MSTAHPLALLTPWYALEPARTGGAIDGLIQRPRRPVLQKYDSVDFVQRLLRDPSDSLVFDDHGPDPDTELLKRRVPEDVWCCPVKVTRDEAVAAFPSGSARRLATYRMEPTGIRKLYQPSHQRFYAVATELSCDEAGYPRPHSTRGLQVRFVMRRVSFEVVGASDRNIRKAARQLMGAGRPGDLGHRPGMWAADRRAVDLGARVVTDQPSTVLSNTVLAGHTVIKREDAWVTGVDGVGRWQRVEHRNALIHDGGTEQELPMWQVQPGPDTCEAARTRSVWFGLPPTTSNEHEPSGQPKLDEDHLYVLRCFVRVVDPDEPACEHLYWSDETERFRLASFFDPFGTRNRRVRVRMPDLRALAAQAPEANPGSGLLLESPPESNPMVKANGKLPDKAGDITLGADNCSFAIELLAIVAMFVFSIFMPILVFLLQLWWMLLLRFCWPSNSEAQQQLNSWFPDDPLDPDFHPRPTGVDAAGAFTDAQDVYKAKAGEPGGPDAPKPPRSPDPLPPVHDPLCQET